MSDERRELENAARNARATTEHLREHVALGLEVVERLEDATAEARQAIEKKPKSATDRATTIVAVVFGLLLFGLAAAPLVWLLEVVYGRIFS